jgi:hypothetical protein
MTLGDLTERHKINSWPIIALCIVLSTLLSFVISETNVIVGLATLIGVVCLYILLLIFHSYQHGFLLLILYAFFMFHFYRVLPDSVPYFPVGTIIEMLLSLLFLSIIVHTIKSKNEIEPRVFRHPVCYALLIYAAYFSLLLFHPLSTGVTNRVLALREIVTLVLSFFIALHVFKTRSFIYFFTDYWIFFALIAALYGVYQEVFGLQDWEMRWLLSQPDEGRLSMVWGHVRKWSFLSDINAFGLLMAYSGIVCSVLALGPFQLAKRIYLASSALLMFAAMTFSGTRTAMAMVVLALVFFVAMTLDTLRSVLVTLAFCLGVLVLFFGPFYGPNFNRLRSTFDVKKDASMNVRDQTRARMQPYIRDHAFGGGLYTTGALGLQYEPDHALAGKWDPDSGYLKTALERGWVGLLIQLGFYATILITGVNFYFRSTDPVARSISCAYLCGFFALSVANYAQDSLDQKPTNPILIASFASLITLSALDKNQKKVSDKMIPK